MSLYYNTLQKPHTRAYTHTHPQIHTPNQCLIADIKSWRHCKVLFIKHMGFEYAVFRQHIYNID